MCNIDTTALITVSAARPYTVLLVVCLFTPQLLLLLTESASWACHG